MPDVSTRIAELLAYVMIEDFAVRRDSLRQGRCQGYQGLPA